MAAAIVAYIVEDF